MTVDTFGYAKMREEKLRRYQAQAWTAYRSILYDMPTVRACQEVADSFQVPVDAHMSQFEQVSDS